MFARKCDRCGKLYENYYDVGGNALYTFCRNDGGEALDKEVYVKDLCPDCMEEYRHFMDGWIPISPSTKTATEQEILMLRSENRKLKVERKPVVLDGEEIERATESGDMPCDAPESSYSGD